MGSNRGIVSFGALFALCSVGTFAGCTDGGVRGGGIGSSNRAVISDQLHSGGTNGFLWMPPMVPNPPAKLGGINGQVLPWAKVRIDETNADGSTKRTLATFSQSSGPGRETLGYYAPGTVDQGSGDSDTNGFYVARWDTSAAGLSTTATYRVHVTVPVAQKGSCPLPGAAAGQRDLGFSDLQVVTTEKQFKTVDTDQFTPLVNGKWLRIKFRIDLPAVDQDGDGVFDWIDNCPAVANGDQKDSVGNCIGDACRCASVTCTALDACHVKGACQPTTGTCTNPAIADGTACPAANATAACTAGACKITACNAGFADCNNALSDGCETSTTTTSNCGACGNACSAGANSTAVCANGQCGLSCSPGYADCDGNSATGCELPTSSDVNNCGGCGIACGNHEACVSGGCTAAVCQSGFANCTHDPNGCFQVPATDVNNCGTCGNVCSFAHASAVCAAGACGIGACATGFANCDGQTQTGCETDTTSDVLNCGGCRVACSFPNGVSACSAGTCALVACNTNYADCDSNAANGCEINTSVDTNNCGSCGNACVLANATPSCSAGSCGIAACKAGFANCDNVAGNGCETNTNTDVANCGACGNACVAGANSTATCNAGKCGLSCAAGFADCDGNAANGCEVSINTDSNNCGTCGTVCTNHDTCQSGACTPAACQPGYGDCNQSANDGCESVLSGDVGNCGACGHACAFPNAVPECVNSSCGFSVCNPGFGDCDGNNANGCEANLGNDPNNCGGCGHSCGGSTCNAGVCAPKGLIASFIVAGGDYTCAIRASDSTGVCWGDSFNGGISTNNNIDLVPAGTYLQMSATGDQTCGLRTDHTIVCWGYDPANFGFFNVPPGQFNSIDGGWYYTCALRADGSPACWGYSGNGELNAPPGPWSQIAGGDYYGCGILQSDSSIQCWGANLNLLKPPVGGQYLDVDPSFWGDPGPFGCAVKADHTIACFGTSFYGDGSHPVLAVTQAPIGGSYTAVSTGRDIACALGTDQTITCWGDPQAGTNTPPVGRFSQIAVGGRHACALQAADGKVVCWGSNDVAQLVIPKQ